MAILYGLPSCDTCRKAKKALESKGLNVTFRDVRADPLDKAALERFISEFGEKLVNTRSTTWRSLTESQRNHAPIDLLLAHPTLMKRPIVHSDKALTLGWSPQIESRHLGEG
ncbi:MAG: hypothetical protein GKR98_01810 [Boseongicola sp.]|nr:MAG: hypothetical protein GKR98_01810 [Boseongicola sp.]